MLVWTSNFTWRPTINWVIRLGYRLRCDPVRSVCCEEHAPRIEFNFRPRAEERWLLLPLQEHSRQWHQSMRVAHPTIQAAFLHSFPEFRGQVNYCVIVHGVTKIAIGRSILCCHRVLQVQMRETFYSSRIIRLSDCGRCADVAAIGESFRLTLISYDYVGKTENNTVVIWSSPAVGRVVARVRSLVVV